MLGSGAECSDLPALERLSASIIRSRMSTVPHRSFIEAFLEQIWRDWAEGVQRTLPEYMEMFPTTSEDLASELLALRRSPAIDAEARSSEPDRAASSDRIGQYVLKEEIGRGSQGVVYRAMDTRIGRDVALKVLRDVGPRAEATLQRFKREARAASKADHPGVCPVYDADVEGGVPYIAMRYVEGETLARHIATTAEEVADPSTVHLTKLELESTTTAESGPLPAPTSPPRRSEVMSAVLLLEKTARALHAVHETGVIHRDVKPGNVMITPGGEAVVMDFGLAHEEESDLPTLTRTGDFFGTPAYMSPEQLTRQGIRLDRRTDVWSLGVMLYECLTSVRPFDALSRERLFQQILAKDPTDVRRLNPAIPVDLATVVATALEKDRDRRYQTAGELADELKRVRLFEPIQARPIGRVLRMKRWAQRNPPAALAVGAVCVGLLVAVVLLRQAIVAEGKTTEALDRADRNLSAYERVSDEFRLQRLVEVARDELWPAVPDKVEPMQAWLVRARRIAELLPALRTDLDGLRTGALPWSEATQAKDRASHEVELAALAALDAEERRIAKQLEGLKASSSPRAEKWAEKWEDRLIRIAVERKKLVNALKVRLTYEFNDTRDRWRHDRLAAFVGALKALTSDSRYGETIVAVEARLNSAKTIQKRSLDDHSTTWKEAIRSIATTREYVGLTLKPQLGLVPLGPDRESGLWEFAHLETGSVPERDPDTGKLERTEETGLVFVLIPAGTFTMGAQKIDPNGPNHDPDAAGDEGPPRDVTLGAYFLSKYEMTQGQWMRATGNNPSGYGAGRELPGQPTITLLHPVEQVDWNVCARILGHLSLSLPTEAQWENGCRAGTTTPWWTGQARDPLNGAVNLADQALARLTNRFEKATEDWVELDDGFALHAPVGSYRANAYGLHDVHGNVWEWCQDSNERYDLVDPRPGDGLRGDSTVGTRITRGGCYTTAASFTRSSYRFTAYPGFLNNAQGLRPARKVE